MKLYIYHWLPSSLTECAFCLASLCGYLYMIDLLTTIINEENVFKKASENL